jgi:hypothetical protein
MEENKNLPTVAKLFEEGNNTEVAALHENLNYYLNQTPPPTWIKEHPFIRGYKYLPIDKIELLLRKIFKAYRIEITGQGTAFNGVWVTVRVHYLNPVTGQMEFHDGIGADQLQTKKDTSPADLANINNGAISMAFPKAKTMAVKDACDHFGKLFGCDINRKDTLGFNPDQSLMDTASNVDPTIQESLDLCTDMDSLDKYIWQVTSADKKLNSNWAFRNAIEATKKRFQPKTN